MYAMNCLRCVSAVSVVVVSLLLTACSDDPSPSTTFSGPPAASPNGSSAVASNGPNEARPEGPAAVEPEDADEREKVVTDGAWYSSAKDWRLDAATLKPTGVNPLYAPLVPGHTFVMQMADHEDGGFYHKIIRVLDETEPFDIPGIGKFNCAVVQEEEFIDGNRFTISKNWYAICERTNNIYTFGEECWERDPKSKVDTKEAYHVEESWRAGAPDADGIAEAGMIMPGTFFVGARYIMDGMQGSAECGAENIETGLTVTIPAGTFENCVRVREYDLLDPEDVTDKIWAPGVGLLFDTSDGSLVESDALPETKGKGQDKTGSTQKDNLAPVITKAKKKSTKRPVPKISEEQAKEIALKKVSGEVTDVAIEKKLGANRYVVEVVDKDGSEVDVIIDLDTGKVLGTEK